MNATGELPENPSPFLVVEPEPDRALAPDHAQRIGTKLRRIRNQQQLSLADVQARSEGVWKAVVVGAYERGDRAVTLARLASLAEFYGVPVADLLPEAPDLDGGRDTDRASRVTLDLTRLDERAPQLAGVARFASLIRRRRGDHNGRVMTLRGGDLETVAMAMGQTTEELLATLGAAGALLELDLTGAPTLSVVNDIAGIAGVSSPPTATGRARTGSFGGGPAPRTGGQPFGGAAPRASGAPVGAPQPRTANRQASRSRNPAAW